MLGAHQTGARDPRPLAPAPFAEVSLRPLTVQSQRVLLIAGSYPLPYRVLRCAADISEAVFVLGTAAAAELGRSRFCRRFMLAAGPINGRPGLGLADQINAAARTCDAALIIGGDADATRSLIAIQGQLDTPCFPMPALETFDLLNDKWRFSHLCRRLAIPHPATALCRDRREVIAAIRDGALRYPLFVKPTNMTGGVGCVKLSSPHDLHKLARVTYAPLIVQALVDGRDVGACAFCRDGRVEAFFMQSYEEGVYRTYFDGDVHRLVGEIADDLGLTGIFNFDIVQRSDGTPVFIECNPRVYYSMMMSMLAGANLLACGTPWRHDRPREIARLPAQLLMPRAIVRRFWAPWTLDRSVWPVLRAVLADAGPYFHERRGPGR